MSTDRSLASPVMHSLWEKVAILVWLLSVLSVGYFSLAPLPHPPVDIPFSDKISHFFAYAWLAAVPMLRDRPGRMGLLLAVAVFFLGIVLEIAQLHVPGRSCSLWDVAANGTGVLAGIFGSRFLMNSRRRT
jgi:VanZ family protein